MVFTRKTPDGFFLPNLNSPVYGFEFDFSAMLADVRRNRSDGRVVSASAAFSSWVLLANGEGEDDEEDGLDSAGKAHITSGLITKADATTLEWEQHFEDVMTEQEEGSKDVKIYFQSESRS